MQVLSCFFFVNIVAGVPSHPPEIPVSAMSRVADRTCPSGKYLWLNLIASGHSSGHVVADVTMKQPDADVVGHHVYRSRLSG